MLKKLTATRYPLIAFCILVAIWIFLPLPQQSSEQSLRMLDRHGTLLYEVRPDDSGSQKSLQYHQIPQQVVDALIATEDRTFFSHPGVSLRGIVRAIKQNLQAGEVISGGSTITQQLVRGRLQPKRRTILYKIREACLALKLDLWTSKEDILTEYLNTSYFGQQAYGIEAAAQTYFSRSLSELSLAQSALLIGLLQSPSVLNPFHNMEGALSRQKIVLAALRDTGGISQEAYDAAVDERIALVQSRVPIQAPHFVFWVQAEYSDQLTGQTEVHTTLDLNIQRGVEAIVAHQLHRLQEYNVTSAAVVVLNAHTGEILSMVGSADYFDTKHDGAVNVAVAARQPGSALKPFTYALALAKGDTPATTVHDTEVQFFTADGLPYTPRNYDYLYHGLVRYREALANSYNIPAVKVLEKVGVPTLLSFLRSAGIHTLIREPEHYGLALTLGSGEVRLLELAAAYGVFARGGRTLNTCGLLGQCPQQNTSLISEQVAWLISDILSDHTARIPEFGEQNPLVFPVPVAAKTGTTRNNRDNWLIGFTPDRIVGVWVGNANNTPMRGTSGITGAGPIFHDVMKLALEELPPASFVRPTGMVREEICRLSGKKATEYCSERMLEVFVDGTQPQEMDDIFRPVRIDTRNGLLATDGCDKQFVTEKVFAFFPSELTKWARQNGWEETPVEASKLCGDVDRSKEGIREKELGIGDSKNIDLRITKPHDRDSFLLDPLIPNENEQIIFEARSNTQAAEWFMNGVSIGKASAPDYRIQWTPIPGWHTVEVRSEEYSDRIKIEVIDAANGDE